MARPRTRPEGADTERLREREREASRRYRQRHPGRRKDIMRKHRYGITAEQYEAMLAEQGGVCAICGEPCPTHAETLSVDHDHTTGEVRGLLCGPCNRMLGLARDSIEILTSAVKYLKEVAPNGCV